MNLIYSHFRYKVCSPTRASIQTGRYPWGVGYYDMKGLEAVPLDYKMVMQYIKYTNKLFI